MKNSYFFLLCYGFVTFTVFGARALQSPDAKTWDELKQATSTSVTSVTENCQKSVTETRDACKASIDRVTQAIQQSQQCSSIKSQIQKAVVETAKILRSVSKNVQGQLLELSNRFQKRLEMAINSGQTTQASIAEELKNVANSPVDETDQLIVSIEYYFGSKYNPTSTLQQSVQQSTSGQTAAADELKSTATNELYQLSATVDTEIDNMEKTIINLLNRMNKGMNVIKELQAALKNGGHLPEKWSADYIKQNLLFCAQTAKTCKTISQPVSSPIKQGQVGDNTALAPANEEEDLSNEVQDEEDTGCARIFERTKEKVLKQLIQALKDIKAMQNTQEIDARTHEALRYYASLFDKLGEKVNSKIIEFIHQFLTLYKVVLSIMDTINQGMKEKMEKIFQDQSQTCSDKFHEYIKKYFAEQYLSEAKINELHDNIKKSTQGADSAKQYKKELSLLTNELGKDLDRMKSTTTYILVEMRKGVNALQNLKNKSNNTGLRYYFNYYTGECDLDQLQKLINLMNILNIGQLIEREINEITSGENIAECENISQSTQQEMAKESQTTVSKIEAETDVSNVREVASNCVTDYNEIIDNFSERTRKVVKRLIIKFVAIFTDVIIIVKRKKVENVEKLEEILQDATCSEASQSTLIAKYLAENADVDVQRECNVNFESLSSDIEEAKRTAKEQIQQLTATMSTQLNEVESQVNEIIRTIIQEAKNLQQLKTEVEQTENYRIAEDRFKNIETIMRLAKSLDIQLGDTTDSVTADNPSSEDSELEKCFENARQRLQTEKSNTEHEIQKCTEISQLQSRTQMSVTNIREIITNTSKEMRNTFTRYSTQFTEALTAYIQSSSNKQFMSQIESQRQSISLSEQLQVYVQDKYSASVLESYSHSVSEDQNIQEARKSVVNSLSGVIKQIETNMKSVKSEATTVIFEKLKQGIEVIGEIKTKETSTLTQEEIEIISSTYSLVKLLQECMTVDVQSSMTEAANAISTARYTIKTEYDKATTSISSENERKKIESQITNAVNHFDSAYNTMRYCVKSQIEQCSSSFFESFKSAINSLTENRQVETVLQDIINGNYKGHTQDNQFQKISSFMNSEGYTSSSSVRALYKAIKNRDNQSIQQSTNVQQGSNTRALSEQIIQQLNNLHTKVNTNIDKTEELKQFVYHCYQEATNIIQLIKEGTTQQLTEEEIELLAMSMAICKTVSSMSNNIDFTSAKQEINQEYQHTVKMIEKESDVNHVQQTMTHSLEKYDYIYNDLRTDVMEKFLKSSSEFTGTFAAVMNTLKSEQNGKVLNVLQDIMDTKTTAQMTDECQEFASYINSDSFTCTTLMINSYANLQQRNAIATERNDSRSIEQLKILTTEMTQHINVLDNITKFVNKSFHNGIELLQSIQSNTELTKEQIAVLTKCVMISEKITECNSTFTRSLEEGKEEAAFANAETAIKEVYESTINAISSATDQEKIKQTMLASVEKYDSIHNRLRHDTKQSLIESTKELTDTFAATCERVATQNTDVHNTLLNIKNKNSSGQASENCRKFISYMSSNNFTSSCLMRNAYINLSQQSTIDTNDKCIQELKTLTSEITQHIVILNTERKFVKEHFHKSIEILKSIESKPNNQLTQDQIMMLTESIMMSETVSLQCDVNSQQMEETFSKAETSISKEYENAVSKIKLATDTEVVRETMSTSIGNYDTIHNGLREEVKQMLIKNSSEFIGTYNSITDSVKSLQNENKNILQDIWNKKITTSASQEYQKFQLYIMSESFTSSSVLTNLYGAMKRQDISTTTNLNEKSITNLQKLTTEVNSRITEMNCMRKFAEERIRKGMEILKTIENNKNIKLTQEQITTLVESMRISESITYQCNSESSAEDEAFSSAERSINEEFDSAVTVLQSAKEAEAAKQVMSASIQKYDDVHDQLRDEVSQTFTQKSSEFTNTYQSVMEIMESQQNSHIKTVLKDIKDKKINIQVSEDFKKCEAIINSESFTSSSIMTNSYQNLQQQDTSATNFIDRSIHNLQTLTTKVNQHITDMNRTRKSVNLIFQRGTDMLKIIEKNIDMQELTQEQMTTLFESVMMTEVIIYQCNSDSLQEEKSFSAAQRSIYDEFETALKTIKTAEDETTARETMLSTVGNYDTTCNNLKEEITQKFTQNSLDFSDTFQMVMEKVKSQQNSKIQSMLQDIKDKKIDIKVSEDCKKSESYLTSERFKSYSVMMNAYENLEQQNTSSKLNFNERNIQNLKTLTKEARQYITEMNNVHKSVNVRLQKATDILRNIESNTNTRELTQEQVATLTESVILSEVVKYQCNSNTLQEEKSFSKAQRSINEGYDGTLNTIKLANEETVVREAMLSTIENYDNVYNNLKEEITQRFTQNSLQFTNTYDKVMESAKSQQNSHIQSILQDIRNKKTNTQESEDYKKCVSYLRSNSFKSSSIMFNSYRNLQQQDTESAMNFNERSAQHLTTLTKKVNQYITELNSVHQSVNLKLQKASDILKSIESNTNIQKLNQEQASILIDSVMLTEEIKYQCNSNALQEEKLFSTAERSIHEEYENTLHALKSAEDEETVKQIMSTSVDKYDSICHNLQEEVKQTFTQNASQFTETYHSVEETVTTQQNSKVRDVLHDIKNKKTNMKESADYTKFKSYLDNDYLASSTIKSSYEKRQQSDSKTASKKERDIEHLKTLTTVATKKINEMNIVREYVNQRLQQGTGILNSIENTGNVELNEQQITILNESVNISEKITQCNLNYSTRSLDQEQEVVLEATSQINSEYENTLGIIKSATNEDSVKQAMSVSVERYSSTYNNLQNNIRDRVNHAQESYTNKFKSTVDNLTQNIELQETLKKTETGQQIQNLQDKDYEKFTTYLESFKATDCVQNIYKNVNTNSGSEDSSAKNTHTTVGINNVSTSGLSHNFNERGIEQLTSVTNQVNEKISEISFIDKYVVENCQKSTTILEKIAENENIQLTEEEIKTLALTNTIRQTLTSQNSTTREVNFIEARNIIQNECHNTINSIRSMKNEQDIKQAVSKNINDYDIMYNKLRDNIKTNISQNSATFTESLKSTTNIIEQQKNTKVQAILQNIQNKPSQIQNKQFQKFSARMNSENFKSTATANDIYRDIQQKTNQSQNFNERSISELQAVSDKMSQKVSEMEESTKYATETIKQGSEILQSVQQNGVTELNEEQITTLATCIQITNNVTLITATVENSQTDTATTSQDIDFSEVQSKINEERNNTINSIRSMKDEKQIQKAVSASVEHYGTMYNEVKEKVQTKITDTSSNFEKTFVATINKSSNNQLTEDLQTIVKNNDNYECDEKMQKLESYVTSTDFKSASAVKDMYEKVKENGTSSNTSERSIEQVTKLSTQVTQSMDQMNEISQYVGESFDKGSAILQRIQTNENIQLTEEETRTLAQNYRIIRVLSQTNNEETNYQGRSMNAEVTTAQSTNHLVGSTEKEIDVVTAQSTINKECDTTIELIKSAKDETSIKQIVSDNAKKYDTVFKNMQQNVQTKMSQKSSTFIDTFESTITNVKEDSNVKSVLQDIANGNLQALHPDTKFRNIVSYVDSDRFRATTVENLYNSTQTQSSSTDIKERSIQEVEHMKQEVNKNIRTMDETNQYVTENLQKSADILQTLQKENVTLNEEQIQQLTQSFQMANVIKKSCSSQQNLTNNTDVKETKLNETSTCSTTQKELKEADFVSAQNMVTEDTNTSINSIRSLSDEKSIKEVVDKNVQKYNKVYADIQQRTQTKVTQSSNNFVSNLQSTMTNVQENNQLRSTLNKIANGEIQCTSKSDEGYQKFESFVNSEKYKSSSAVIDAYKSAQNDNSSDDVKVKSVREIQTVSQEVQQDISVMDETYKYVSNNFESSAKILQQLQEKKDMLLTNEQTEQLARSVQIAQTLDQCFHNNTRSLEVNNTSSPNPETTRNTNKTAEQTRTDNVEGTEENLETQTVVNSETMHNSNKSAEDIKTENVETETQTVINSETPHNSNKSAEEIKTANVKGIEENVETETQTIFDIRNKITTIFVDEETPTVSITTPIYGQCQSTNPKILKQKTLDQVSLKDLMVHWQVKKLTNQQWPCSCFDLSWTNEKFQDQETKRIVAEISELLRTARNLVNSTIQLQRERMKLSHSTENILSRTTICSENIDEILSETSTIIDEEIQKLLDRFKTYLQTAQLELRLQSQPSSLDQQLVHAGKIFYSLQSCKKTDLLDLIDQQFSDMKCDTWERSKEITSQKFDQLKSTMESVFNNIDCLMLRCIDTIISGEIAVRNMNTNSQSISLEIVKNAQILCDIINQ